ncbi:MAG: hypothetical protein ACI353_01560 [Alloprevotella sp.]
MKKYYLLAFSLLLCLPLWVGCSQEETDEAPAGALPYRCRLVFDVSCQPYGDKSARGVAASEQWDDKTCIYLSFRVGDSRVDGRAVYDLPTDEWTLYYNGVIPAGTAADCMADYFRGSATEQDGQLLLSDQTAVFHAVGSFEKTAEGMKVRAELTPLTGRIRFRGESGRTFSLSGVSHYVCFDLGSSTLVGSAVPLTLTVGADGFTPYVYPYFAGSARELVVAYDNYSFVAPCEHPVLDPAQAGFMQLPTEAVHNGWNMTKVTLPEVSRAQVTDIGVNRATFTAEVTSDGNADLLDCGFVCSTAANPTTADTRFSCGTGVGPISLTPTSLSENTLYHVRAYAVNALGVCYSEDVSFRTLTITLPTLSAITLGVLRSTTAELTATVTSAGNGVLKETGLVYSTSPNPTLSSDRVTTGKGMTIHTSLRRLSPQTTYYVRAYATNERGTGYSSEFSFTTTDNLDETVIDGEDYEGENNWDQ